jgi:hypothetical protein
MRTKDIPAGLFRLLASYGFVVVVLALLLVLTFLGTLEQVDHGLYSVQKKYFESIVLVHWCFDVIPLPLPGAYLLMTLLFVNLCCGAIIRARKSWRRPGMLIAHSGILLLLLGGFVTFKFSIDGNMRLYEGEAANKFQSFHEWEIEIAPVDRDGAPREALIIPHADLADLKPQETRTFHSDQLPFDLVVSGYAVNSRPMPASGAIALQPIDGFYLTTLKLDKEGERNVAGAYATVAEKETGKRHEGILWGLSQHPYAVRVGDRDWTIRLTRQRWTVPFTLVLDQFTKKEHPGTSIPATFMSDVTKVEGRSHEKINITMNEPLRHHGYTFFQSSWGPQGAGPGEQLFSVFAVVRNPADQWPLYACIVVTAGLLIHFGQKLVIFLRREQRQRQSA